MKMDELRRVFRGLGYTDVSTYIQSGNVIFRSEAPVAAIDLEVALRSSFEMDIKVVLRSRAQMERVVGANPFAGADPSTLHVGFMAQIPAGVSVEKIDLARFSPEEAIIDGLDVYFHLPNGMGRASFPTTSAADSKCPSPSATGTRSPNSSSWLPADEWSLIAERADRRGAEWSHLSEFGHPVVAVVTFAPWDRLAAYRAHLDVPFPLLSDVDRRLYRLLGAQRAGRRQVWSLGTVRMYVRLIRKGRRPSRPKEDVRQMGADVVIGRGGVLRYVLLPATPASRPPIADLLAALD